METMQRLASQMDGLALANRGLKSIRPAKKIVALPKRVKKSTGKIDPKNLAENSTEKGLNDSAIDLAHESSSPPTIHIPIHDAEKFTVKTPTQNYSEEDPIKSMSESDGGVDSPKMADKAPKNQMCENQTTTSGYGSETSLDSDRIESPKTSGNLIGGENDQSGDTHCVRCHKVYDPSSKSGAEMRCVLPHPTKNVVPIKRDSYGTDFACLCCRTEFRLPKMAFYEAGVNSMLTGFCFIGHHTTDTNDIDYQEEGGAALCCEEAGCIEYFV